MNNDLLMNRRKSDAPEKTGIVLAINLFGSASASLCAPHRVLPLSLSPRSAELLAFLALGRGQFFGRDEIAEALWDADNETTSGSVNTAVWRLRRSIEVLPAKRQDLLTVNRHGGIGLNGPMEVYCDVHVFDQLLKPHRTSTGASLDTVGQRDLEIGIALYRDAALGGFRSNWALRERERLRNTYLDALRSLMQHAAARRDFGVAIHYARLLLATDGLREDVHRELMRLLVLDGQRAAALRQFEICRSTLKRELAIQPMRETLAIYQQISDRAVASSYTVSAGQDYELQ
jgi:DNA-binding SARP family transcriptional activator